MNYLHLYYFWTASKEKGFLRASKKLAVSQSTVSTQIQLLEKSLGKSLILRGPRTFELTQDGQKAFAACERIFSTGQSLLKEFGGDSAQELTVRIGYGPSVAIDDLLSAQNEFKKQEGLCFQFEKQETDLLLENLMKLRLDVVICDSRPSQTKFPGVIVKKIRSSNFVLAGKSKWQRKAKGDSKDGGTGIPLCLPSTLNTARCRLDDWTRSKKIPFQNRYQTDDANFAKQLALEGKALALLPYHHVEDDVEKGQLFLIHEFRDLKSEIYLCSRKNGVEIWI